MGCNPSAYQPTEGSDSLPVENVSFDDVQLFIDKLNAKTGKSFSLPTEAQWEYAARGGVRSKGTAYAGSKYPNAIWYDKEKTFKIRFNPSVNELGIYQMSGNVAEWCVDYYNADFYEKSQNCKNPVNIMKDKYRVIRGGSFNDNDIKYITVYYRDADNRPRPYVGLRLVIN